MTIHVIEENAAALPMYATIPSIFLVRERFAVHAVEQGLGGLHLVASTVDTPYRKEYDALLPPEHWPTQLDLESVAVLSAFDDGARVGGAVIAYGAGNRRLLDDREDVALLWDLRVTPALRGHGVGSALFAQAETIARTRGASWLKVETQDVNVPACRLYARHGCVLGAIHRFAYPTLPDEVQLLWYKRLLSE